MKRIAILLVLAAGAWADTCTSPCVAKVAAQATVNTSVTTGTIDITSGSITAVLVIHASFDPSASHPNPTLSSGDTLSALTQYGNGGTFTTQSIQFYYKCGPTLVSNLSASVAAQANMYSSLTVIALTGTATSSCIDSGTDQGGFSAGNNTLPAITPNQSGDIIISGLSFNNTTAPTVDSSMIIFSTQTSASVESGIGAYLTYNSVSPLTVTWTHAGGGPSNSGAIVGFVPVLTTHASALGGPAKLAGPAAIE